MAEWFDDQWVRCIAFSDGDCADEHTDLDGSTLVSVDVRCTFGSGRTQVGITESLDMIPIEPSKE